jgi:hypothetical protein
MLDEIRDKFNQNISRSRNLVSIHKIYLSGKGPGRRATNSTDVLRAATVMLHATLEEFLRDLSRWKLPSASEPVLNDIPMVGSLRSDKILLGKLSNHRGKTVDQVIIESIESYLERSNYNNVDDIAHLFVCIGIDNRQLEIYYPEITEMIKRRHQIVHRADYDTLSGPGHHHATSIGRRKVTKWIEIIVAFAAKVCNLIERLP